MSGAEMHVTTGFAPRWQELYHDMRQPVASVFALAAAALAEPGLPQAARARVEEIIRQAEWLAKMIQHALNTTAGAGGQSDLAEVAHEVVAAERTTWTGEIMLIATNGPVFTAVHPIQLHRMIANLLGNATRASGPSGRVTLTLAREEGTARLSVEDSGPGFGKIQQGHGLGLDAVVREATRHGGSLDCGDAQGGGARVCLTLPAAAPPQAAQPPGPTVPRG